jgi:5-methyltetrahydrofolate--homocysteine methyltransferase
MNRADRIRLLEELPRERILVLDGAMGTALQSRDLTADDFGGAAYEGCNEYLVITRPDVILDIHNKYLEAGADILETDTFGSAGLVLAEYKLEHQAYEITRRAAELARQSADAHSTPAKPRFVAGSMGPTTKAISVTGGVTFQQLIDNFKEQARALVDGGVDALLLETAQDTRNVKAGLIGIEQLFRQTGSRVPIMVSCTIEPMGTMLAGQTAEAFEASVRHAPLLSIGLNCATGPEFMTDHMRSLHEVAGTYVSCVPNAGLPDEEGHYLEGPEKLAAALERFANNGWLNFVGGCCGTNEKHIHAIAQMVEGKKPRVPRHQHKTVFTGIDLVEANDDNRPLIVGERTNEVGSRLFKQLITEEKYEEASEIARRQVKHGAHIIDINLQNADRDELGDVDAFYDKVIRKIKAPFMIDTTNVAAIERALTYCQGKSIINSVNLEDGEEKFELVCPLARSYGAALVVGCIDEDKLQAQAITRERKLEIAVRSHKLLTEKYGIPEEDIVFDPLVFPCGTGDQNYVGSAVETIEGIRLIKQRFPRCKTVLGISNISFGLPLAGREVLNSVFLYHCSKAGLDLAIVNSEKIERFASLSDEDRKVSEDLLWNRGDKPIETFTAHFRQAREKAHKKIADLPLDQRLANYILEGTKDGLVEDLQLKLKEAKPLEIINGPLMAGMAEVGRLFNANELIVAEVLQSAEAMKAAVSFLEQFMEKAETAARGKIVLATVKGDVHDIGKNLVEIILKNNGYSVVNLGIKIPPEELIKAYHEHRPDAIGLSGLLVKSAQQMVITAADLRDAGIQVPLLVGGAALSDRFTRSKIAPSYNYVVCYAKDAMEGLRLMDQLGDPKLREKLVHERASAIPGVETTEPKPQEPESTLRSSRVKTDLPIPSLVDDMTRKKRNVPDLDEIWSFINPQMLYVRHMGFKGNFEKSLAQRDPKAIELESQMDAVKDECRNGLMKVRAVWQFFEAEPDGNKIHLFQKDGKKPAHTFQFRRQRKPDGLCLSDYVLPPRDGTRDHVALFVVGAGFGLRERSEEAKNAGEYIRSHALQALGLETAEACAEWLHRRLREDWGFPDPAGMTMLDRFQARYRGKRYSFGYPACPNLEDQAGIWKLLTPEDIGIHLTEGFMMEPEASVSALVLHHPDAIYFSVETDERQ